MSNRKNLFIYLTTALFIGGLLPNGLARELDLRRGFSAVARKATPAVVFIQVEKQIPIGGVQHFFNNPFDLFGEDLAERFFGIPRGRTTPRQRQQPMYRQVGQGSGFIVSKDGYILTNTHVVGDAEKITVKLSDGREFAAKRVGADTKTEVALIKIEGEGELPVLEIGNPDELQTGEWVVAIGNPFGLKETLTVGVVSAKGRTNVGITDYEDFIQTDAAINPGNSGGPLLNVDGEVVGINTAIYSRSGGYMGIGFAVPIDMAISIKDQLVATGRVTRGYIGVIMNPGELTSDLAASLGHQQAGGVLIAEVEENGPADKAGIRSGDILVTLNGVKIKDQASFRNDVARILPNTKAKITLYRDGKPKDVTVTVETFPDELALTAETEADFSTLLGFEVEVGDDGLVISAVDPESEAALKGVRPGMQLLEVNRMRTNTLKDFQKALKKGGKDILLKVKNDRGTFFLLIKIQD